MGNIRKQYLWLPYVSEILPKQKRVFFRYKGGRIEIEYKRIHSIMLYGATCELNQLFLEKCSFYQIPITIHRRHMPRAVWINSSLGVGKEDLITNQILFRQNEKKKLYISKKLLKAKFKSMEWLIESPSQEIHGLVDIKLLTGIEAWHSKNYWQSYYNKLGCKGFSRRGKGKNNYLATSLDSVSKFISGILLRWITYHNLSPYHGFLHIPTEYPSLVYDLMEPYRGYIDKVVFDCAKEMNDKDQDMKNLLAFSIEELKIFLDSEVYIDTTRQVVTFHELYHGIVLALRSYLLGNKRFVVPIPGTPNGGRPIIAGYKMYGRNAGKTDFWPDTKNISNSFWNKISK